MAENQPFLIIVSSSRAKAKAAKKNCLFLDWATLRQGYGWHSIFLIGKADNKNRWWKILHDVRTREPVEFQRLVKQIKPFTNYENA